MIRTTELEQFTYFRGRVALFAILRALGVGPGDQVITQAFTCLAVPEAIMARGAQPVYADVEPAGFNMDASDLRRKLTARTRAVIIQHTYGIPADLDGLLAVVGQAGLPLIEDCCHTIASTYHGILVGRHGVAAFYSYEWGKPVVVGIGGSAVIHDPSLREAVRAQYGSFLYPGSWFHVRLRAQQLVHQLAYRPFLYYVARWLYHRLGSVGAAQSNYNPIDPGHAARDFSLRMAMPLQGRLHKQLAHVDELTRHSPDIAEAYAERIQSPVVAHVPVGEGRDVVYARYPLLAADKPRLLAAARRANVELAEWYTTPIHPVPASDWQRVGYEAGSCPQAEMRCRQVVTLPVHATVGSADVERTIQFFNECK